MKLRPIRSTKDIRLDDEDARGRIRKPPAATTLARATAKQVRRIAELQRVLYGDGRHALLIVLQGRDASGKDGTIRKVFTAVNPQGCAVTSFAAPSPLERRHDYLWRVHAQIPPLGMIGIFNRSHYEDILVPQVRGQLDKDQLEERYRNINEFERLLAGNGVTILKFMLHISRDEQRARLEERLTDPTKNWKFQASDLEDRARWDEFDRAYRGILKHTSTRHARWYVVPADDKGVRNWLVARTIADTLEGLDLRYPKADPSVIGLTVE
jgi:PPK2 family polyphosphate:nucleotide phosphotransferase